MSRPTSRVLALLELLQSGGTRRVADLADRLGVDERTVRRYAEHLVDLDIPVRSVRGRYGGYTLAPGYKLPPLMFTDDEAVAVAIGLVVGRRAGLVPESVAAESAAAKLRRVLPTILADRVDALLATSSFTSPPRAGTPVATDVLLALASAARSRTPVDLVYADRRGRRSTRRVEPQGVVGHAGRWYLVAGPRHRTFRLDRITTVTPLDGTFAPPAALDPAALVLDSLARTPWTHPVSVRVQASADEVERRLPLGLARLSPCDGPGEPAGWVRLELNAERLAWVPALLAGLDRPFVVEGPGELRDLVGQLGERLTAWSAAS